MAPWVLCLWIGGFMLALSGGSRVSPNNHRTKTIRSGGNKGKKRPQQTLPALPCPPAALWKYEEEMAPVWGAGQASSWGRMWAGMGPPASTPGKDGVGSLGRAAGGRRGPRGSGRGEDKQGDPSQPCPSCTSRERGFQFQWVYPFTPGRSLWVTVAVGDAGWGRGQRQGQGA